MQVWTIHIKVFKNVKAFMKMQLVIPDASSANIIYTYDKNKIVEHQSFIYIIFYLDCETIEHPDKK